MVIVTGPKYEWSDCNGAHGAFETRLNIVQRSMRDVMSSLACGAVSLGANVLFGSPSCFFCIVEPAYFQRDVYMQELSVLTKMGLLLFRCLCLYEVGKKVVTRVLSLCIRYAWAGLLMLFGMSTFAGYRAQLRCIT